MRRYLGILRVKEGRLFFFDVTLTSRDTFKSLIGRKEFIKLTLGIVDQVMGSRWDGL